MFLVLLFVTLGVSLATAGLVVMFFRAPIRQILERIVGDSALAAGWQRFLTFALFVVGVSAGVQIWKLEQYLQPQPRGPGEAPSVLPLTGQALALEVYRTLITVLQGMAWALLVFFVIALVALAIVRWGELRAAASGRN